MKRFGILMLLFALCSQLSAGLSPGSLNADIYGSIQYSGFNGAFQVVYEDNSTQVTPIISMGGGNWLHGPANSYHIEHTSSGFVLSMLNNSYILQYPCLTYSNINYFEFVVSDSSGLTSDQNIYFPGAVPSGGSTSGNGSWYCLRDELYGDFVIQGDIGLSGSFSDDSFFEIRYGFYDSTNDNGGDGGGTTVPAPGAILLASVGTVIAGRIKRHI